VLACDRCTGPSVPGPGVTATYVSAISVSCVSAFTDTDSQGMLFVILPAGTLLIKMQRKQYLMRYSLLHVPYSTKRHNEKTDSMEVLVFLQWTHKHVRKK